MKIKYLIIVSFFLAIFTIGAISASDNLTEESDVLEMEDNLILKENSNPLMEETNKSDSSINVSDIECNYGERGTCKFSVEGGSVHKDNVSVIDHPEAIIDVNNSIIGVSGLNAGNYTLKVITTPDENHNPVTATASILVKKYPAQIYTSVIRYTYGEIGTVPISVEGGWVTNISVVAHPEAIIEYNGTEIRVHGLDVYYFYTLQILAEGDENHLDTGATTIIFIDKADSQLNISNLEFVEGKIGTATFNISGATINESSIEVIDHPEAVISLSGNVISVSGLAEGNYTLKATTTPDNNHNSIMSTANITVFSIFDVDVTDKEFTVDDKLSLKLPSDASGILNLYIDGKKVYEWNVSEFNNEYFINIKDLGLNSGKHNYSFEFISSCGYPSKSINGSFTLNIKPQEPPRIVADDFSMMYGDGSKYSVKVYGYDGKPASNVAVTFKVGNKQIGVAKTNAYGIALIKIKEIPKKYFISVQALGQSITKKLTVKHILTVKKVKVKRSAKRLIIKASLKKVNGKYLKGKKIIFKFKGKKYIARTNKKGVAKVIIKKKVLKKLKRGKKITYSATYIKDTVKKTVKVRK